MQRIPKMKPALYACLLCTVLFIYGIGRTAEKQPRPDLVTIVATTPTGQLERPPVVFPHDLHTEATKDKNQDCTICHAVREDGRLSLLFKRLEDPAGQSIEELYHGECIGCHADAAADGLKTGPEACGDCHRKDPVYLSARQSFGFDKSLHYRHIKAHEEKCTNCHHIYDEKADKLIYVEGKEDPCRDCHRARTEDNRSSFRLAAHESCVGCHRDMTLTRPGEKTGPLECAGCHDSGRQAAIEIVSDPPRLKRGQPDFVILSAPDTDLEHSKLNTVPFSHIGHESATNNCRVCHHETLARCNECHTLPGDDKGDGVTLQQAMHKTTAVHSCAGCHNARKSDIECAGCHDLMEQGKLSEHACGICHAGPAPENLAEARERYTSVESFRTRPADTVSGWTFDELPDTVTISSISSKYKAVVMPHRKIVNVLRNHISNSKVATFFHGNDEVVCEGCHHHGSVGRHPALCENCHGQPFREDALFTPGLKGAYHRQCLGCHVSMGLQAESNCAVCHKDSEFTEGVSSVPTGKGAN
jgi:hypothetical protein